MGTAVIGEILGVLQQFDETLDTTAHEGRTERRVCQVFGSLGRMGCGGEAKSSRGCWCAGYTAPDYRWNCDPGGLGGG
jgi:hypothetical protein